MSESQLLVIVGASSTTGTNGKSIEKKREEDPGDQPAPPAAQCTSTNKNLTPENNQIPLVHRFI